MYKLTISFLFLFYFTASSQYRFEIKGYINNKAGFNDKQNIKDGDLMILRFYNLQRSDTVRVKNDSFVLSGIVPIPSIAMLEHKGGGNLFLIDNSDYEFFLTKEKISKTEWQYNGVIKTQSTFFNTWKSFSDEKRRLYAEKTALADTMEHVLSQDSILYYKSIISSIDDKIAANYKNLAKKYPNSYAAAYIIPAAPDFSYKGYIDIYNAFSDSIKNSFYGRNFYGRLMASKNETQNSPPVQFINKVLPVVRAIDTSYNPVILDKSFYAHHKYTFIEFWASWCAPCRVANEDLREMKEEFNKKHVTLVCFSLDNASEPWKKAVKSDKVGGLQISDLKATNSNIVKNLNIEAIPFNIIVDTNGKIIATNIYHDKLIKFLESIN